MVLSVNTHIVAQQAMHPDVLKSALFFYFAKLALPIGAKPFICPSRTDTLPEDVSKGPGIRLGVNRDFSGVALATARGDACQGFRFSCNCVRGHKST